MWAEKIETLVVFMEVKKMLKPPGAQDRPEGRSGGHGPSLGTGCPRDFQNP